MQAIFTYLCKEVIFLRINREIVLEAKRHGIDDKTLRDLMKEYKKIRGGNPKNFADLIEGAVC